MKPQTSKWSLAGAILGAVWIVAVVTRYYVIYQDMDKLLSYSLLGILIIAVSYLYNCKLNNTNRIVILEDYLGEKKK